MKSEPAREDALFAAALAMPPAQRATFLDGACYGEPALRQRLEARLAARDPAPDFRATVATPEFVATVIGETTPNEEAGLLIGRHKLLEKLGEGGFGTVWAAEQKEPIKRRVALKIIKLGMDTKQVVARFEAER